jgi:Lar family restriction alleviation protein
MNNIDELLPCPFCGGKAHEGYEEAYSVDSSYEYVGCSKCTARILVWKRFGIDHAKSEWNKRISE